MAGLREILLAEIAEELGTLKGKDLDAFLREIGEDPDKLLKQSEEALARAIFEQRRMRLIVAREAFDARRQNNINAIAAFDISKKHALLDAIKLKVEQAGDGLTIAARNRTIASEEDLDSVLEAFLRLGLIDEAGNVKE